MASPDTSKGAVPTGADTKPQTQNTTTAATASTSSPSQTPAPTTTTTTAPNQPPPAADSKPAQQQQQQQQPAEKKLTGAELKARAKAEKAARRAAKAVVASPAGSTIGADAKGKGKPKDGAGSVTGSGKAKTPAAAAAAALAAAQQQLQQAEMARKKKEKEEKEREIPEIFSHLPVAKQISYMQADKDTHFVVLVLGQQMGSFVVTESTDRMYYTLLALKKVIEAYITPAGNTLSRHFTSHMLNPQIEYLADCRPMCFSMGNAIRWLKLQIARIDVELSDEDAKKYLCEQIDDFAQEKVIIAQSIIIENAAESIQPGDVVVTYASHSLVKSALLKAHRRHEHECQCSSDTATTTGTGASTEGGDGSKPKTEEKTPKKSAFKVIVVDDAHDHSGAEMAKQLQAKGINVVYTPDVAGALRVMKTATKTLLAAEAVFSNGAVYARAGTADVALAARDADIEVNVMCESINFTERMATDSLTYNEIDPNLRTAAGFRLLFDTTAPEYVSTILSEHGGIRPHMVPGILKRMEFL